MYCFLQLVFLDMYLVFTIFSKFLLRFYAGSRSTFGVCIQRFIRLDASHEILNSKTKNLLQECNLVQSA